MPTEVIAPQRATEQSVSAVMQNTVVDEQSHAAPSDSTNTELSLASTQIKAPAVKIA